MCVIWALYTNIVHKQCRACACMHAFLSALSVQGPDPGGGGGEGRSSGIQNPPFELFHDCALHMRGTFPFYMYSIKPLFLFGILDPALM